jgi:hypothetical protein
MNELSEFFKTVSIEKTRVAEERKRFTPRVEIKETDLSDFFGTVKTGQQNQIILAQREGTKLDALQTFFTRLQTFEDTLKEQIEKQKPDNMKDGFDPSEVEGYEEFNSNYDKKETEKLIDQSVEDSIKEKTESQKLQDQLEPITENKDRFPTAEERWPRAGEVVKQVEIKPVNYFNNNKRPEPKVENTIDVNSLAEQMSGLIKKPEQLDEQPQLTDLEKLQREFTQFRKLVTMQMASIGGGGEVRLLNLDDVDTSSLGNGKFLVYNATSKKLEFTDQVDGN